MVTIGLQATRFIIQFSGLVVLGRLLAPADFGLVAMVTAIIGIGDIIREFGLVPAAIQSSSMSKGQRTNLFWFGAGLGILVALLCCLASQFISLIYQDNRLIEITLVLSLTFVFNGFQTQFQAGLAREMKFVALSLTDVFAQIVGLGLGVGAAIAGFGYWAIVVQLVAQSASLLIFRIIVAGWTPGLPVRNASIRSFLKYGQSLVLTQSLVYVTSNVDSLLVGSKFGAEQLGFYNRGFQILMMPLNQILTPLTSVALPVLSQLKDESGRFNSYLQRAQLMVAYPAVILFSMMAACAQPLIRIVFGEQWLPSAAIFQVLAIAGAFQAVGYIGYWVFLSKGLTGSHLRFSLISRSILLAAIVCGSNWGPVGIAAAYSLGTVLNWPLALLWLRRAADLNIGPLAYGGIRAIILGLTCAGVSTAVARAAGNQADIAVVLIVTLTSLVVIGLLSVIVRPYRKDMAAIVATAKLVVAPRVAAKRSVGDRT
ncbi:lipopolysaccharide biosynthesis protein [Arthrobacter sp. AL12]|nr:lipopolysaccharide biosynthesis protein [Arthrobacter sp. AL12]